MNAPVRDGGALFGAFGHPEAARLVRRGLTALRHRAEGVASLASGNGDHVCFRRTTGAVADAFGDAEMEALVGTVALGSLEHAEPGAARHAALEPMAVEYVLGAVAIAFSGHLAHGAAERAALEARGAIFQSTSDAEVILHRIATARGASLEARASEALDGLEGAFAVLLMDATTLVAARDRHGIRPLLFGAVTGPHPAFLVASEACAFDHVGASVLRSIGPGEMLVLDGVGARSERIAPLGPTRLCAFEHVRFARSDSAAPGGSVYAMRRMLGALLAAEHPAAADIVLGVPEAGVPFAVGYAEAQGTPLEHGLVRGASPSLGPLGPLGVAEHTVLGRRVVIVDAALDLGPATATLVRVLRDAGAREVHLRSGSPEVRFACPYGTIGAAAATEPALDHAARAAHLGADSVAFLSLGALERGLRLPSVPAAPGACTGCLTGQYPLAPSSSPLLPLRRRCIVI